MNRVKRLFYSMTTIELKYSPETQELHNSNYLKSFHGCDWLLELISTMPNSVKKHILRLIILY